MAVATLWIVSLGQVEDLQSHSDSSSQKKPQHNFSVNSTRQISCFLQGLLSIVARLLNGQSLALGRLYPLPWTNSRHFLLNNSS
jgi:hypothetical protein